MKQSEQTKIAFIAIIILLVELNEPKLMADSKMSLRYHFVRFVCTPSHPDVNHSCYEKNYV